MKSRRVWILAALLLFVGAVAVCFWGARLGRDVAQGVARPFPSTKAKRSVPSDFASRPDVRTYALFGAEYAVRDRRDERPNARGEFQRVWLVETGGRLGRLRIEERVQHAAADGRETILLREVYVAGEFLVAPQPGVSREALVATLAAAGATAWTPIVGTEHWTVSFPNPDIDTKPNVLRMLAQRSDVIRNAEGNGVGTGGLVPNDPQFSVQYSLLNTGQSGGVVGADVRMTAAWDIAKASPDVIVAVLDSGIDFTHPDLKDCVYRDPREIDGNGIDEDNNGFIDDVRGWNFVGNNNNPADDHDHGSHVSGIIGARGNNGLGVAGITWGVQILPVKVLDSANLGTTANMLAGINYARGKGAKVMNLSLINYPFSSAVSDAIQAAQAANILLVVSAGNSGTDNDVVPNYPSSYPQLNVISVANTTRTDVLNTGSEASNYGANSVDLAAPGTLILSTVRNGGYALFTGTSMAAPHVTGVAALLLALRPQATVADLRQWILGTVDPVPALTGKCATGGRLNAQAALLAASRPPTITTQPASQNVAVGGNVTFATAAALSGATVQWQVDGSAISGATNAALTLTGVQPTHTGLYAAIWTNSLGSTTSDWAILGVTISSKVAGTASQVGADIVHPSGQVYDQVQLQGSAATVTADLGQVTRTSYIDLNNDIVQVEFSGAGMLSIVLDSPSGPAPPVNYTQASSYMKGHAEIVITGANESTNASVFTVGRATAFDPTGAFDILLPVSLTNNPTNNGSSLFQGHAATLYDGVADIAFITISSVNGKFGGLRTSNTNYFATKGLTGIYAPGVEFTGPVFVGNINAFDAATPVLIIGSSPDTRVTGGDLLQANGQPVKVSGLTQLKFTPGQDSQGRDLPAKTNRAVLQQNGADVTTQIVVNPGL